MSDSDRAPAEDDKPADRSLQGSEPVMSDPVQRAAAIELAFDYRGDVTLHLHDGRIFSGYIFDRRAKDAKPNLRILPADADVPVRVDYDAIARLIFTGRDTAAGKSWETWVKKYQEKKSRGEEASIHAEPLE